MSLQKRCLNEVQPRDRERGVGYFHQRRVSLGERERDGIAATVEGSGGAVYEVRFDWSEAESDGFLGVSCSCQRFADFVVCKHVWATMVAFDRAQFTEPVPGKGPLDLALDPPGDSSADDEAPVRKAPPEPRTRRPPADISFLDAYQVVQPYRPNRQRRPPEPPWKRQLGSIRDALTESSSRGDVSRWPQHRVAWYRLNVARCFEHDQIVVDFYQRKARKDGELGRLTRLSLGRNPLDTFTEEDDRKLLQLFSESPDPFADPYSVRYDFQYRRTSGVVPPMLYPSMLPLLCATQRFGWQRDGSSDEDAVTELKWDDGPPWRLRLELTHDEEAEAIRLRGALFRDGESRPLTEPILLLANGAVVWTDQVASLDAAEVFPWISLLRREREIRVPEAELDTLLEDLSDLPELPALELPPDWDWHEDRPAPRPCLSLRPTPPRQSAAFEGDVSFDYEGSRILARRRGSRIFDRPRQRIVRRDWAAERAAFAQLKDVGFSQPRGTSPGRCDVQAARGPLPDALESLLATGWEVTARDRRIRPAEGVRLEMSSGIDWFELRGDVDFAGARVTLPSLLAAVRRGERMIDLGDGSQGLLPLAWLERYAPLAGLSPEDEGDAVRYLPTQAALLDTLLAAEPEVDVDRRFATLRRRLNSIEEVAPASEPRGFRGELRAYQREGLGWLRFLQDLGLGGCLADDMGLGKTIQVLALLQTRRLRRVSTDQRRPSLIVAPSSLVHNWIQEAARFTPRLSVISYTGPKRKQLIPDLDRHDVVVTTYGLMRRDAPALRNVSFDYAILDEAQAIKNAGSQAAKAARLIRAEHRLALTGTPVENHIGELWSIFEFLNPGMLGALPAFRGLIGNNATGDDSRQTLARALAPFILRRRKQDVLKDLPEKTEQTLYCELDHQQKRHYKELRDHYRASLDRRIESVGLGKSKIHVLEALLRLRQAACHPGLLDPARDDQPSAKLDTLLEQIDEVLDGGHKALVFSQFVRLLEIVKQRLDNRGTAYEYLDGKTRDRPQRIERFQTDPDCRLFLISLKAGGLGLNLTAADYVFILDPWWNPAVEAQAVDRAHRIGQTRPVFAYRLIARGTVEEKILKLQQSKRELADAILSASGGMMRDLSVEDLRLLLS